MGRAREEHGEKKESEDESAAARRTDARIWARVG